MSKRRLPDDCASSSDAISPPAKAPRLSSGHSPPRHRLSLANCWEAAGATQAALFGDRLLASVFSDWDMSFNGALTESELAGLLGMNPATQALHLRRVDLSFTGVSDAFLLALGRFAPNLEAVRLEGCLKVSDAGIAALAQLCPKLAELSVARCAGISDLGVAAAARHLPLLQALDLRDCSRVTGEAMKHLVARCPLVQVLRLGGTAVDAATLSALFSYFLLLELDLSALPLTDAHLVRLADKQPLLQSLDVSLCHGLTRQGVEQLLGETPLSELKAFGLASQLTGLEDERVVC